VADCSSTQQIGERDGETENHWGGSESQEERGCQEDQGYGQSRHEGPSLGQSQEAQAGGGGSEGMA